MISNERILGNMVLVTGRPFPGRNHCPFCLELLLSHLSDRGFPMPFSGRLGNLTGWCHGTRDSSKCQTRKKRCSQISCFVVRPKSDLTGERKQRRMCGGVASPSPPPLAAINTGKPNEGTPHHCREGNFRS